MSENERRCYWSSCSGTFELTNDRFCLDIGTENGYKFAYAIQQMCQEPILFKGNALQRTETIAMQIPIPELSHHTCFCRKHSKRIRDFSKLIDEKANLSPIILTIDFAMIELGKLLSSRKLIHIENVHRKVALCWPNHLYSSLPDWYFPFSFYILSTLLNSEAKCVNLMDLQSFDWNPFSSAEGIALPTHYKRIKETVDCLTKNIEGLVMISIVPHAGQKKKKADNLSSQFIDDNSYDIDKVALCHQRYSQAAKILIQSRAEEIDSLDSISSTCDIEQVTREFMKNCRSNRLARFGNLPILLCEPLIPKKFLSIVDKIIGVTNRTPSNCSSNVHARPTQSVLKPTSSGIFIIFLNNYLNSFHY